ncbi:MAG: type VI secretion system tip protein TssI/VgrG [Planctomycetota bacterium]
MASADRSDYRIEILCPDLQSELRLERGSARERLGMLFEIDLSLYSEDKEIDLAAVLGQTLAVHVGTANDERYFHGIVCHFSQVGISERYGHYHAVLRPKFWLQTQSASCKVFTSMTVQDILKKMLQQGGVDFDKVASEPAVRFEHCVQYRETDHHFASRLMERYGLYYYHAHEKDRHVLQIASSVSGHADVGTFEFAAAGAADDENQITDWRATTSLRSAAYKVTGTRNLTRDSIDAGEKTRFSVAGASELGIDDFEAVDEYERPWLEELAKARMQAIDATVEEFTGRSQSPKLGCGTLFKLDGHPRADMNRQYLIVAASYQFDGDLPDGGPASEVPYRVAFTAIDSQTPFSPPIVTRKPVVQGPHLATVTEETDEYGRVLVQFRWGNPDGDLESCRARVSQNWAGKEWGGVFLPHTGHEVIVEFLDGDPDQPLVTGRVYNEQSMPPLALPGSKSQSIIRDQGGNEILMEGAEGSQKIRIWCPTHNTEMVMGNSIELTSDSNFVNRFLGWHSEDITKDQTSKVGGNKKTEVKGSKEEHVFGKLSVKIGGDVLDFFLGAQHKNVVGMTSTFIGGVKKEHIVGAEMKRIDGVKVEKINGAVIKKGSNKEVKKYPEAMRQVGGLVLDKLDDWKCKIKGTWWDKVAKRIQEADEAKEKAENVTLDYKYATFMGDQHDHTPSDKFCVFTDEVMVHGMKVVDITGKSVKINGTNFEVKE